MVVVIFWLKSWRCRPRTHGRLVLSFDETPCSLTLLATHNLFSPRLVVQIDVHNPFPSRFFWYRKSLAFSTAVLSRTAPVQTISDPVVVLSLCLSKENECPSWKSPFFAGDFLWPFRTHLTTLILDQWSISKLRALRSTAPFFHCNCFRSARTEDLCSSPPPILLSIAGDKPTL